jgi:chromate transporter
MAVLPVLHHEFVETMKWVTPAEFAQALAFGQITPGPIVITATVLGYLNSRWMGAAACTLGIFLPAFLNTLLLIPAVETTVRGSARMEAFVRGAMPWIIGSILAAGFKLGQPLVETENRVSLWIFLITLGLGALPFRGSRLPPWALIPTGGLLGLLQGQLQ